MSKLIKKDCYQHFEESPLQSPSDESLKAPSFSPLDTKTSKHGKQSKDSAKTGQKLPSLSQANFDSHRRMVDSMESCIDDQVPPRFPMRTEDRRGVQKCKQITQANLSLLERIVHIQETNAMEKSIETDHDHNSVLKTMKSNRNFTRLMRDRQIEKDNTTFYNRIGKLKSEYAVHNTGKRGPKIVPKVPRHVREPKVSIRMVVNERDGDTRLLLNVKEENKLEGRQEFSVGGTPRHLREQRRHRLKLQQMREERERMRSRSELSTLSGSTRASTLPSIHSFKSAPPNFGRKKRRRKKKKQRERSSNTSRSVGTLPSIRSGGNLMESIPRSGSAGSISPLVHEDRNGGNQVTNRMKLKSRGAVQQRSKTKEGAFRLEISDIDSSESSALKTQPALKRLDSFKKQGENTAKKKMQTSHHPRGDGSRSRGNTPNSGLRQALRSREKNSGRSRESSRSREGPPTGRYSREGRSREGRSRGGVRETRSRGKLRTIPSRDCISPHSSVDRVSRRSTMKKVMHMNKSMKNLQSVYLDRHARSKDGAEVLFQGRKFVARGTLQEEYIVEVLVNLPWENIVEFDIVIIDEISSKEVMRKIISVLEAELMCPHVVAGDTDGTSSELANYLGELFRFTDKDSNGVLSFDEFAAMMEQMRVNISITELAIVVSEADENFDGVIDYDEFVPLAMSIIQAARARDQAVDFMQKGGYYEGVDEADLEERYREKIQQAADIVVGRCSRKDQTQIGAVPLVEFNKALDDRRTGMTKEESTLVAFLMQEDKMGRIEYTKFPELLKEAKMLIDVNEAEAAKKGLHAYILGICRQQEQASTNYMELHGVLSRGQISKLLQESERLSLSRLQIITLMSGAKLKEGHVNYLQFLPLASKTIEGMYDPELWKKKKQIKEQMFSGKTEEEYKADLKETFKRFSTEDEILDFERFKACIHDFNSHIPDSEIQQMYNAADEDGDETVSVEEFLNFGYENLIKAQINSELELQQERSSPDKGRRAGLSQKVLSALAEELVKKSYLEYHGGSLKIFFKHEDLKQQHQSKASSSEKGATKLGLNVTEEKDANKGYSLLRGIKKCAVLDSEGYPLITETGNKVFVYLLINMKLYKKSETDIVLVVTALNHVQSLLFRYSLKMPSIILADPDEATNFAQRIWDRLKIHDNLKVQQYSMTIT